MRLTATPDGRLRPVGRRWQPPLLSLTVPLAPRRPHRWPGGGHVPPTLPHRCDLAFCCANHEKWCVLSVDGGVMWGRVGRGGARWTSRSCLPGGGEVRTGCFSVLTRPSSTRRDGSSCQLSTAKSCQGES